MIGKIVKLKNSWGNYIIKPTELSDVYINAQFAILPVGKQEWKNCGSGAFLWGEVETIKVLKRPNKKMLKIFP